MIVGHTVPAVDPDRPKAAALADLIRGYIREGRYHHGEVLPAEGRLSVEHGVSVDTVRRAMATLRAEGLVVTRPPYGTTARRPERRVIRVPRGSTVTVWMPSPEERREHGLPEGVPGLALTHPSGRVEVFAADEVELTFS